MNLAVFMHALFVGLTCGSLAVLFYAIAKKFGFKRSTNFAQLPHGLIYLATFTAVHVAFALWFGAYDGNVVAAIIIAFCQVGTITFFDALRLWRLKRQTEMIVNRLDKDPRVLAYMAHVPLRRDRDEHKAFDED